MNGARLFHTYASFILGIHICLICIPGIDKFLSKFLVQSPLECRPLPVAHAHKCASLVQFGANILLLVHSRVEKNLLVGQPAAL